MEQGLGTWQITFFFSWDCGGCLKWVGKLLRILWFFWVARDVLLYVMVMKCWDDFSLFIEYLKLCWMLFVTSVIASKVLCIFKSCTVSLLPPRLNS